MNENSVSFILKFRSCYAHNVRFTLFWTLNFKFLLDILKAEESSMFFINFLFHVRLVCAVKHIHEAISAEALVKVLVMIIVMFWTVQERQVESTVFKDGSGHYETFEENSGGWF